MAEREPEKDHATFSEFTQALSGADEAYRLVLVERVDRFSRCTDILCGAVARGCAEGGPCCDSCCHPLTKLPEDPTRCWADENGHRWDVTAVCNDSGMPLNYRCRWCTREVAEIPTPPVTTGGDDR